MMSDGTDDAEGARASTDDHERRRLEQTHPENWPVPTGRDGYHLVVIGGGTAGLVCAGAAAGLGADVALIEEELLGGDCLNDGCVPSKALLRCARAVGEVRRAGEFGVEIDGSVSVDFQQVMERMRRIRADMSVHDSAERFESMGVDVFLDRGRFVDETTVEVSGRRLNFWKAIVATGASPAVPPIEGLDEVAYQTSQTIFSLERLPDSMVVLGGGPVGCELAQAFERFGSDVTLLEQQDRILPADDPEAAAVVAEQMERDGVDVRTGARAASVESVDSGLQVTWETDGDGIQTWTDELLVATGRSPNVSGMGLEDAGIAYEERGGITVDDRLQTTNGRVFAAGDVAAEMKFTHAADSQARTAVQNALFWGRKKQSRELIPWCTYTEPAVAQVGATPHRADEAGVEIETFETELGEVDRALLDGETDGFVKVHVRSGTDEIVGGTVVGPEAGELISELTLAMDHDVSLGELSSTIRPYPTLSEAFKKTSDAYNRTRVSGWVESLLETWWSWMSP